jgi:hypothetical protein
MENKVFFFLALDHFSFGANDMSGTRVRKNENYHEGFDH